MAYCGILDSLIEINGKPVDFSHLDEGILIAGDKEYAAEDFISEEEKLDFYNETALRTKEDILKDIDSLIAKSDAKAETKEKHSQAFYERYKDLLNRFRDEIEKCTFPQKLEDWWRYEYEVRESGITLSLKHADMFDIERDDYIFEHMDTTFTLKQIKAKLLTVEQYAQAYGVTTTTVRQWIRRGKIRTAIKLGSEWRIPELAEITERGYKSGHYERKEYLTDVPAEYAFINDYDYIDIDQNEEHKEYFDLCFSKKFDSAKVPREEWEKYYKEIQLDQKEREKLELYLISNPLVEASEA